MAPPPFRSHRAIPNPAAWTILSEGAGAVLLGRQGPSKLKTSPAEPTSLTSEATTAVEKVFDDLCQPSPNWCQASANGTFIDEAEAAAIEKYAPKARVYAIKQAIGESVGASTLWQTIAATKALITQKLPGPARLSDSESAMVSACGLNQQVAGLLLEA